MRDLSASALLEQLAAMDPSVLLLNLLVCIAGVSLHYVKKVNVEDIGWKAYWLVNRKRSMIALSGVAVSFVSLVVADPTASLYTFFTLGYIGDSMLNRPGFAAVKSTLKPNKKEIG